MRVQVIQDSKGKATGVYIPINEWKELKKKYRDLEALEQEEPTKEEIVSNLKKGFEEMALIKKGKLKTTSLNDFLNEL